MARRAATPRPPPPARLTPLRRIADLAGRAVTPDRMRREVEALVADLLSRVGEDERIEIRSQLSEMAEQLADGVDAAREAVADLDREDRLGLRQAEATVTVLRTAHAVLVAAHLRL